MNTLGIYIKKARVNLINCCAGESCTAGNKNKNKQGTFQSWGSWGSSNWSFIFSKCLFKIWSCGSLES